MNCKICGAEKYQTLWPEIKVVKCECGHVYYNEDISDNDLTMLYSDKYFHGEEYGNYVEDKEVIQKNFQGRLNTLRRYQGSGNLLEIGSAYGFFLDLAKKFYKVEGYEICEEAANYARNKLNVNVKCGDFLKETVTFDKDVVCLFDCIEHLKSPDQFMAKANKVLRPGGKIMITTGDISALVPRFRGKKWRLIHPPTHIHYFSSDSLTRLLEKNGFNIISLEYPGVYRSFNQLVTSLLKRKGVVPSLPGYFWLNTYDVMEVIAEKI